MSQPNKFRIKTALAALENPSTPGTDAVPAASNAVLLRNLDITPVYDMVARNNVKGHLGADQELLASKSFKATAEVELAGSGTQGTAPAWGILLMACGFAETSVATTARIQSAATKVLGTGTFTYTKTAAPTNTLPRTVTLTCTTGGASGVAAFTVSAPSTSVDTAYSALAQVMTNATPFALCNGATITPTVGTAFVAADVFTILLMPAHVYYTPVSDAFSTLSTYGHHSKRKFKMLYMRGNAVINLDAKTVPVAKLDMAALNGGITTESAPPTVTLTAWKEPVVVNAANTSTLTLHGHASPVYAFSYDQGATVKHIDLPGQEFIALTDRNGKGSTTIVDPLLTDVDYHAIVEAVALGGLNIIHGKTPGNIIEIQSSYVQPKNPKIVDKDGDAALSMDLGYVPSSAGNDEIKILVY